MGRVHFSLEPGSAGEKLVVRISQRGTSFDKKWLAERALDLLEQGEHLEVSGQLFLHRCCSFKLVHQFVHQALESSCRAEQRS